MTAPAVMGPPVIFEVDAHLDPDNVGPDWAGSWFITFGFGAPAQGFYTEVAFARIPDQGRSARVLDEVARLVAISLYGTAWAFIYPPEQYEQSIARYGLRRRERVIVRAVEAEA